MFIPFIYWLVLEITAVYSESAVNHSKWSTTTIYGLSQ